MRTAATALALMLAPLAALSGCRIFSGKPGGQKLVPSPHLQDTAKAAGLAVTLKLPKRVFAIGETVKVTIVARNLTDKPIRITAETRAYCVVRLWRHTGLAWEEVKQYPPTAMQLRTPWTLPPEGRRVFQQTIPVEPDWPTGLALRMTAELNGTAKPVPMLTVKAEPRPAK